MRAFTERAQLLPRRMAALDLNADKLAGVKPSTVRELVERCTACESPEQCEWDLRQDAANLAWQAYCPSCPRSGFGRQKKTTRDDVRATVAPLDRSVAQIPA